MPLSHPQHHLVLRTRQILLYSAAFAFSCCGHVVCAQVSNAQANKASESSQSTTEFKADNVSPSRTTESHATIGNRQVDNQHIERIGPNGDYQPYSDTEKETIQENSTTTRVVVRTYIWDADRRRHLVRLTQEESQSSSNGDSHLVRMTSNSDANGNLQVALREVADATNTSPNTQQVQTTTYTPDGAGGFRPNLQIRQLQTRKADQSTEVKKTTLQLDGNGKWTIIESGQSTITQDGKTRVTDERISRIDANGKLSEVARTIAKQTENADGGQSSTTETYSVDTPGAAGDGALHLIRRDTSVERDNSGQKTTEQSVEERDPGNPSSGLRTTSETTEVVQSGPNSKQKRRTFLVRDANGTFNVVGVEARTITLAPGKQPQPATESKTVR